MQTTTSTDPTTLSSIRDSAELATGTLKHWMVVMVAKLPNIAVALIILAVSWLVARIVRDAMRRTLERTSVTTPLVSLITTLVGMAVLATGAFVSLGVLGLDKTVSSLLAGVGIVGIALGFAFQDIAANFMAGIVLSVSHRFGVGQIIQSGDHVGTVQDLSLQSTTIQQFTGELVWLPNRTIVGTPLVNLSALGERRVDLDVRVSYDDDLERARSVAIAAVENLPVRRVGRPVDLFYTSFDESWISFTIRFWTSFARHPDYLEARSEAMIAIRKAFDREGITVPYPVQRFDLPHPASETLGEERARPE